MVPSDRSPDATILPPTSAMRPYAQQPLMSPDYDNTPNPNLDCIFDPPNLLTMDVTLTLTVTLTMPRRRPTRRGPHWNVQNEHVPRLAVQIHCLSEWPYLKGS